MLVLYRFLLSLRFGFPDMSCISVTDDGKGISEQDIEEVFLPYYSTKKLGIGLGLTITKRFVEEHGGTISAASIVGEETVVTIRIPAHGRS